MQRAAKRRSVPPPRVRLEVDARRAQLVALGLELFSKRAYDDVSIDDLARVAKISKGLLYHYFPTKRDFYAATVREAARQLLARTEIDPALPPLERLDKALDAYFDYVEEHGAAFVALLRGGIGADREIARIVDRTREGLLTRIRAGIPWRADDPLVRAVLRGWIGFVEAASIEWIERGQLTRLELHALCVDTLRHAIERATDRR
jgi:AcrR family transcriptional regulator